MLTPFLFSFATEKSLEVKRVLGKSDVTTSFFLFSGDEKMNVNFLKAACFSVRRSDELLFIFSTELKIIAISL